MDRQTSPPPSASGAEQDAPDFDYPDWFADAPPPPSGDSLVSEFSTDTTDPVTGEDGLPAGTEAEADAAEAEEPPDGLQPEELALSFDDPDLPPPPPGDSSIEEIPEEAVIMPEHRPAVLAAVELHLDIEEEPEPEAPDPAQADVPRPTATSRPGASAKQAEAQAPRPAAAIPAALDTPAATRPTPVELPDPGLLAGKPRRARPVLPLAIAAGIILAAALGAAILFRKRTAPVALPGPAAVQPAAQTPAQAVSLPEAAEPARTQPLQKKKYPFATAEPVTRDKPGKTRKEAAAAKPVRKPEKPLEKSAPEPAPTAIHLDPEPPPKAPEPEEPEEAEDGGNPFGWMKKNISGTLGKVNDAIEGRRKAGEKK